MAIAAQLIPAGELVTVPEPAPRILTVNVAVDTGVWNVATRFVFAFKVTAHVGPAEHVDQLLNVLGLVGVSVSVIAVPLANFAEQVPGHEIPAGELDTEPEPTIVKVKVNCVGGGGGAVM